MDLDIGHLISTDFWEKGTRRYNSHVSTIIPLRGVPCCCPARVYECSSHIYHQLMILDFGLNDYADTRCSQRIQGLLSQSVHDRILAQDCHSHTPEHIVKLVCGYHAVRVPHVMEGTAVPINMYFV